MNAYVFIFLFGPLCPFLLLVVICIAITRVRYDVPRERAGRGLLACLREAAFFWILLDHHLPEHLDRPIFLFWKSRVLRIRYYGHPHSGLPFAWSLTLLSFARGATAQGYHRFPVAGPSVHLIDKDLAEGQRTNLTFNSGCICRTLQVASFDPKAPKTSFLEHVEENMYFSFLAVFWLLTFSSVGNVKSRIEVTILGGDLTSKENATRRRYVAATYCATVRRTYS